MSNVFFNPELKAHPEGGWRAKWYRIIFHHDTPAGLAFDISLIWIILASVAITISDSVAGIHREFASGFYILEWIFTAIFLVEYVIRLMVLEKPLRYARSALGIIDFLSILPAFISLIFPGSQYLLVVRLLRVLRVFRLLKLSAYLNEANILVQAMTRSSRKIGGVLFHHPDFGYHFRHFDVRRRRS